MSRWLQAPAGARRHQQAPASTSRHREVPRRTPEPSYVTLRLHCRQEGPVGDIQQSIPLQVSPPPFPPLFSPGVGLPSPSRALTALEGMTSEVASTDVLHLSA